MTHPCVADVIVELAVVALWLVYACRPADQQRRNIYIVGRCQFDVSLRTWTGGAEVTNVELVSKA